MLIGLRDLAVDPIEAHPYVKAVALTNSIAKGTQMSTNQAYNAGIRHLGRTVGGEPVCKNRGAHIVEDFAGFTRPSGYRTCKRCELTAAKWTALRAKRLQQVQS